MASVNFGVAAEISTAFSRQFPQIDKSNPADSFFKLIRTGKYLDSDTEYGANTVVREYDIILKALQSACDKPTFPNQIVAERQIETLLEEVDNDDRFKMARQIVLTMKNRHFATSFAAMAEITYYLSIGNADADRMIESLLKNRDSMEFVGELCIKYETKPALAAVFENLLVSMKRIGLAEGDEAEPLGNQR